MKNWMLFWIYYNLMPKGGEEDPWKCSGDKSFRKVDDDNHPDGDGVNFDAPKNPCAEKVGTLTATVTPSP